MHICEELTLVGSDSEAGLEQRKYNFSVHETWQGRIGLKRCFFSVMVLICKYGLLKVRNEHTAFLGQSSLALLALSRSKILYKGNSWLGEHKSEKN